MKDWVEFLSRMMAPADENTSTEANGQSGEGENDETTDDPENTEVEVTTPKGKKATVTVEDAGSAKGKKGRAAEVEDDPDDDLPDDVEELKKQLTRERAARKTAETRASSAVKKLTPLEQAEKDRKEREAADKPLAERLKTEEKARKAAETKAAKLEEQVMTGHLERQLRKAGYGDEEIDDIVELALDDEIVYDEDKGRYSLDLTRFVERKTRYDLSKREEKSQEPSVNGKSVQTTPGAKGARPRTFTEAEIGRMDQKTYEENRAAIFAAKQDGRLRPN